MDAIEARGITVGPENLKLSDKATISMPWHKVQDGLEEDRLAKKGSAFGSTRRAIAYAYSVHPRDKKTVGVRLADIALQKIYKMSDVYSDAPQLGSVGIAGNKALLNIGTFGRGLQFRGEPRGFDVCVDGKWVKPVSVKLDGDVLTVEAAEGAKITGVRYAWKNWAQPEVCLFNRDGLPLIPFSY